MVAWSLVNVWILLTIITFLIWIALGIRVRKPAASEAAIHAVTYAITVLIVLYPCAISLAVPTVVVMAERVAAQHSVVFQSAYVVEVASKTTHVVFDKTGTLTQGKLSVEAKEYPCGERDAVRVQLLGLVTGVKHPVSIANASRLVPQGTKATEVEDIKSVIGKGIEGTTNGACIRAGNTRWLRTEPGPQVKAFLA
jgi:Cu2+-exporting ATPase